MAVVRRGRADMSWQPELDELRERERLARELGGADKVKRQHDAGKLTIRERIDGLVDPASFHEIGAIAGKAQYDDGGNLKELVPSNCVFGRARIDGRPVVVVGDDFTVRGGSADATIREKPLMAEQMAHDLRLPIIRILEGSGGGGSVKRPAAAPICRAGSTRRCRTTSPPPISGRCRWWRWGWGRSPGWARRGWRRAIIR
jgi:acetyl-CoA carboxylase carboxyltransferase component